MLEDELTIITVAGALLLVGGILLLARKYRQEIQPCTRPVRACYSSTFPSGNNAILVVIGIIVLNCAMVMLTWTGVMHPLLSLQKKWDPARCTLAADARLSARTYDGSKYYIVRAPVTLTVAGVEAKSEAMRWPSSGMEDANLQELYSWWISIGGTGKVLKEPISFRWYPFRPAAQGSYELTTPVGTQVDCWYTGDGSAKAPVRVKLDGKPVPQWGYWIGVVLLIPLCILFFGMVPYMGHQAWQQCNSSWRRLETFEETENVRRVMFANAVRRQESWAGMLIGAKAINRSNSHLFAEESDYYVGSHTAEIRNGFLRKVYGIVTAQVLFTVAVALAFMYFSPLYEAIFLLSHAILWPAYFGMFCSLFGCYVFKNEYPLNYLCLAAFTFATAIVVGVVCGVYRAAGYEVLIWQAMLYTALLTVSLTLWAMQTKFRFDFLAVPLALSLPLLLVAGFCARLLGSALLHSLYIYFGALIFCAYIVYDTKMISERLGYDDYIIAAIELCMRAW